MMSERRRDDRRGARTQAMRSPRAPMSRVAACLLAAAAISACASAPDAEPDAADTDPTTQVDSPVATLQSAGGDIERAIGQAGAASLSECRLVGLGERPCGGPRAYVAYSLTETDSAHLASLVEVYNRLDRERNTREGLVSTCEMLARPEVALEGGQCVTRPIR